MIVRHLVMILCVAATSCRIALTLQELLRIVMAWLMIIAILTMEMGTRRHAHPIQSAVVSSGFALEIADVRHMEILQIVAMTRICMDHALGRPRFAMMSHQIAILGILMTLYARRPDVHLQVPSPDFALEIMMMVLAPEAMIHIPATIHTITDHVLGLSGQGALEVQLVQG